MKALKILILLIFCLGFISFKTNLYELKDQNPLKLYLPDDLKIELWAESPMLYNPTNMDTDAKGRIWVTEGVNYRNFNNDSTQYYHHNQGDRVMILTDTDQDGKADQSKVFVQDKDLVAPLGIAVLGNQILVSCAPYLIKYTDENGDDEPDKKEIFLKGFGGFNHDHSLHSIVAGPNGKWYFNVGNAGPHNVTDKAGFTIRSGSLYTGGTPYNLSNKGNQKSDDGKVWVGGLQMSIQPDGTQLKVLGHNFRNSYETYIDGHGDMWQNDNDDQVVTCRVSWLAEGGNAGYFSEDGTRFWNADQRPSQDMFRAHWHQDDPKTMPAGDNSGAGSPTGMLRNEGDALGIRYRGMLLSADAGRNVLFAYHPKRTQSGYNLKGGRSIFLSSNPSDDPSYEWNNKTFLEDKTKWFRPSDILVGTDGALYVSDWYDAVVGGHQIKDNKAYGRIYRISPKNKKLTNPKLDLESLAGQVNAFKNSAVNVRNQAYSKLLEGGEKNGEAVKKLAADTNPFIKSRALWLLAAMNGKGQNFVKQKLKMGSEEERIVAMRAMRSHLDQEQLVPIIQDKTNDPSAFVRREAILALENFDYKIKNPLLISFAKKIPTEDQYYINAIAAQLQNHEEDFYLENKELLDTKFDLLFALHPNSSVPFFENIVKNPNEKLSRKQKAITAIGFIKSTDAVKAMVNLQKSKDEAVAEMAAYWLSFRSTNDWFDLYDWSKNKDDLEKQKQLTKLFGFKEKILNNYVAFADRKRTALEMLKSQEGSQMLLEMLRNQRLSADLEEVAMPLLLNHPIATIKYQAQSLLGTTTQSFDEKEIIATKGNLKNGQEVFKAQCSNCHKIEDTGQSIGPELTKIHKKLDKRGLYEAIIYPSSSIVFGFESYNIATKDGRSYYGFLVSENEKTITLKDLSGAKNTINQSQIKSKTKDQKSIMPSAMSMALSQVQMVDLLEYLSEEKK